MKNLIDKLKDIQNIIDKKVPEIIGTEAVNDAHKNFERQSFDGKKWKDVKRRDSSSSWYGFKYGAKSKKPNSHPSRKNSKKPYKARKTSPITNYSPTATQTPILSSQGSELENSISFKADKTKVTIYSDKQYANVHNQGLNAKTFGKKSFKMPKRQFIGMTKNLENNINKKIEKLISG